MGLHRTDIALCCYWVFHAADRGFPPQEIRGYRKAKGHDIDKIMRVLNAFYRAHSVENGHIPIPQDKFNQRKRIIKEQAFKDLIEFGDQSKDIEMADTTFFVGIHQALSGHDIKAVARIINDLLR